MAERFAGGARGLRACAHTATDPSTLAVRYTLRAARDLSNLSHSLTRLSNARPATAKGRACDAVRASTAAARRPEQAEERSLEEAKELPSATGRRRSVGGGAVVGACGV